MGLSSVATTYVECWVTPASTRFVRPCDEGSLRSLSLRFLDGRASSRSPAR